jgi:hypothetical protein
MVGRLLRFMFGQSRYHIEGTVGFQTDLRTSRQESGYRSTLLLISIAIPEYTIMSSRHTESHGYEGHDAAKGHLRLMFMVCVITIGPETILLVVVGVARNSFVGVDLFDMAIFLLGAVGKSIRGVYNECC